MPNTYRRAAIEAARLAGSELRARFREPTKQVVEKLSHDLKLNDDQDIERLIVSFLRSQFPDHGFFGEEGIATPNNEDYCWVIDPIDGTVNYFQGIPHFSTSLALFHKGNAILGVVYDPIAEDLFVTELGGHPTLNQHQIFTSNNVEQVCIASPVPGRYRITVTHSGGLAGGPAASTQAFSIVSSGDTPRPATITGLLRAPAGNQVTLQFTADPGAYFTVQTSVNLTTWTDDGSVYAVAGPNTVNRSASAAEPKRYWRLKRGQP